MTEPVSLAYASADELLFGSARRPVTCGHGVVIGGGEVLPEVNFTLPTMLLREETLTDVRRRFKGMVTHILQRAVELGQPALVLEFEQLYELTRNPEWGAAITADMKEVMDDFYQRQGLRSALRVTVADVRDQDRPPLMRTGRPLQLMLEAFRRCAEAGADILSIESTGGKEISDHALMAGDLDGLAFALGVLAPRDMAFLWERIVGIARQAGVTPGGDTACGFGNTAMQLAHQGMIPRMLAAVTRLMAAPRSLVAVEQGATGPLKDCGYENPILKTITGVPISMEGKSSACAHSSPLGNITAATCDLWSNESVQDVRLLGGFAPEVFTEVLVYDCRLFNTALRQGAAPILQELLVRSDHHRDPQALMLDPAVMWEAGRRIQQAGADPYTRTVAMARWAVEALESAFAAGEIALPDRETRWRRLVGDAVSALPEDPEELRARLAPDYGSLWLPQEYGLQK